MLLQITLIKLLDFGACALSCLGFIGVCYSLITYRCSKG